MKNAVHRSILGKDANNFNLVRLIAALVVIYSHSYAFSNKGAEWIASKTGITHAGELSVVVFFFISGALITKSLAESPSITSYLIKRIIRIYPALIICCFFVAYISTWLFGGANFAEIVRSGKVFNYFISNSLGVWNVHFIPGVFESGSEKGLNGSLWSITLELRLYLVLAFVAAIGFLKSTDVKIMAMLAMVLFIFVKPDAVPIIGSNGTMYGSPSFPIFSAIFLLGGIFYIIEQKVSLNYTAATLIFGFFLIIARHTEAYKFALFSFVIAFSLWFSTRQFIIKKFVIRNDYSYGIYLYGWPAQQIAYSLLVSEGHIPSPSHITLIAVLLATILASLSWHYVEKPCIAAGRGLTGRFSAKGFPKIFDRAA